MPLKCSFDDEIKKRHSIKYLILDLIFRCKILRHFCINAQWYLIMVNNSTVMSLQNGT